MIVANGDQADTIARIIAANPGRVLSRVERIDNLQPCVYVEYDGSAYVIGREGQVLGGNEVACTAADCCGGRAVECGGPGLP